MAKIVNAETAKGLREILASLKGLVKSSEVAELLKQLPKKLKRNKFVSSEIRSIYNEPGALTVFDSDGVMSIIVNPKLAKKTVTPRSTFSKTLKSKPKNSKFIVTDPKAEVVQEIAWPGQVPAHNPATRVELPGGSVRYDLVLSPVKVTPKQEIPSIAEVVDAVMEQPVLKLIPKQQFVKPEQVGILNRVGLFIGNHKRGLGATGAIGGLAGLGILLGDHGEYDKTYEALTHPGTDSDGGYGLMEYSNNDRTGSEAPLVFRNGYGSSQYAPGSISINASAGKGYSYMDEDKKWRALGTYKQLGNGTVVDLNTGQVIGRANNGNQNYFWKNMQEYGINDLETVEKIQRALLEAGYYKNEDDIDRLFGRRTITAYNAAGGKKGRVDEWLKKMEKLLTSQRINKAITGVDLTGIMLPTNPEHYVNIQLGAPRLSDGQVASGIMTPDMIDAVYGIR